MLTPEQERARRIARAAEIRGRLEELSEYARLTEPQQAELDRLAEEATELQRDEALWQVRTGQPEPPEPEERTNQPRTRASRAPQGSERGQAFGTLDTLERDGYDRGQLDRLASLLESVDDVNVDPDEVARYIRAAGDPAYLSAFRKAFRSMQRTGTPAMAALEFTDDERQAWIRAQQYAQRALASGSSVLVPAQVDPIINLSNAGTSGAEGIRRVATVRQTTSNTYTAVTSAGVTATYAAELAEVADGSPTLGSVPITIHRGHAMVQASYEVQQDATGNFEAEMTRLLLDGKDRAEATAFVEGTGTNQPWGIAERLRQASKTVATATADVLVLADLYSLVAAVPNRWRARGQWLFSDLGLDQVRRLGETVTGNSAHLVEGIADGVPDRLLGRPLTTTTELDKAGQTTAAGNDNVAVFGDLRQYVIADRLGALIQVLPAMGAAGRPIGGSNFYLFWRNGADYTVPDAARLLRA